MEGRKPKPCGHEEVPTFQAGDGEAEVLEVVWVEELVKFQSRAEAATSLQAGVHIDDVLGYVRLDEGDPIELAQELDEPAEVCFGGWVERDGAGVLSGECVEKPGEKNSCAGGALGGMEELAEETLELLDQDGCGSEQVEAERSGFFHLERVYSHGEPDGVKDRSNPSDYDGGALALVWGCIQAELVHEVQEVLVVCEG